MLIRVIIVIPVYNNPLTISEVVRDCLANTDLPIMILDDGSDIPVQKLLSDSDVSSSRIKIVRHEVNLGKGAALKRAFDEALINGYTHILAMDGDGQHLVSEIPKFLKEIKLHPWSLIIGKRKFQSENVPKSSKFGRAFSNFWVKYQTETLVEDSQSGFRAYPLFHVQHLSFWTKRFDFEIEILIRLLWKKVDVREVEIDVYYPKPSERVSHFDKFRDNVRISTLNTIFVILSLLKTKLAPSQLSAAVGFGILIGCTPFFGLHALIAMIFSVFLRLNALALLAGTQISIPIIAPTLAYGSITIGKEMGLTAFHQQWLLGSLVLGTGLGLGIGLILYVCLKLNKKTSSKNWNGRIRGGKFGNWFLSSVTKNLGLKAAYFCLNFVVPYFYLFAPKARRSVNHYWKLQRPELSWIQRQMRIMGHFLTFAKILIDRIFAGHRPDEFKILRKGQTNIVEGLESKEGLIMVSAHVGGWALSSAFLQVEGLQKNFNTVEIEADGVTFNKIKGPDKLDHKRVSPFVEFDSPSPIFLLREKLAHGEAVGMMADRPLGQSYELVLFFGKLAVFDSTPFRIAASTKARLLKTFSFKGRENEYHFLASKPEKIILTDKEKSIYEEVSRYTQELEENLRKFPDQWFNFYSFWESIPKKDTK
jgi:predicted LPLAT superfamily acyltransferase/glycosyltransferase involved in cell wall biosynthesis